MGHPHAHDHDGHQDHHGTQGHHGTHGHHGHERPDWAALASMLEAEAELHASAYARAAAWLGTLRPDPGFVVDAGSGPGVVSGLLADTFPGARVVAVDASAPLLERAAERARRAGYADRFSTLEAELPDGLADVDYPADLLWASRSVHHLGDQRAAVAAFAARLAPGGLLALLEGGLPARYLPRDIGFGRPGLEARLDVLEAERFIAMRAELPEAVEETEDWAALLTAAGLEGVTSRSFLLDVPAPLPDAARALVVEVFRRRRDSFAGLLDPADLAALDRLLDPGDPASLHRRPDVFVLAAHTVHVGRVAA